MDDEAANAERRRMISALSTNVTSFFREAHHFDILKSEVLPPLLRDNARIRIWSAGCSTGQEAYSIALALLEVEPDASRRDIRILASDIDDDVVAGAREAVYPEAQLRRLPAALRSRHFHPAQEGHIRAGADLRRLVCVRRLNLLGDWPMTGKFDAIFCRNVVIYFDTPTQARLWKRFSNLLNPGGWQFLGHSERVQEAAAAGFRRAGVTAYRKVEDG